MTNEVNHIPGTELDVDTFAEDFVSRIETSDQGMNATEADAWAKEQLGGEPTDEQKAAVTPAILTKLDEKMKSEQAVEAPAASEDGVNTSESSSDADSTEEATTPADNSENAAESVTEASEDK